VARSLVAAAAVAATESLALQALTRAALVLPGLLAGAASGAEPGTLSLQVSRYAEGDRDLVNVDSGMPALRADSLHLSGEFLLRDSIRASIGLAQDTWSGATPVAVAPLAANGNRPILRNTARGTVVAGASPMVNGRIQLDATPRPLADTRNVLIMASASPEIRKQADFSLEAPLPQLASDAALTMNTSISDEPDFRSRYGRVGGRFAFNDRLTTLSAGAAFTRSDNAAALDPDLLPYLTRQAYATQLERQGNAEVLRGERRDRAFDVGLTQVLDSVSALDAALAYTEGSGFMENPYKAVTIVFTGPTGSNGDVRAFLEQRPDTRRQLAFHAHYARHFAAADATLQLDYTGSRDDWGIDTHSVEVGWAQPLGAWMLTPRVRYYTQDSASFHTPWLVSPQHYRTITQDSSGDAVVTTYSPALLPAHFSSDYRLASFGALSAGLTAQRHFDFGLTLEAGFEFYRRNAGLRAGGGTDSGYADFDFTMANLAFTVDLGANARRLRREQVTAHADHGEHATHVAPASLMFVHSPLAQGAFMSGYRASHSRQHGTLLHGTSAAADANVVANGCTLNGNCRFAPAGMAMTMHMLDFMFGLNASTTLMLMPQYVTMDMELRELAGGPAAAPGVHAHGNDGHVSGALGDTLVGTLFSLHATAAHAVQASLAVSVPTGKTDLEYRRQFQADGGLMHYDMQTGSGTWDLLPTLTWTLTRGAWQHGAQISAIKRLGHRNNSGYRLGDELQLSGWTAHALSEHLSASLRAVWLRRGAIDGSFNAYNAAAGPMDFAANHGGRFVDLGIGINVDIAGSQLAVEWLAPVYEDVNGFQLERRGTLSASWHYNY
jgi:hypothetical protein